MHHFRLFFILLLIPPLTGCAHPHAGDFSAQVIPQASVQPPILHVYVVSANAVEQMDVEAYLQGVVAGEMPNHWPLEALKAQAILARTFVLKFITEKDSKYPGAHISTDISEAQAYNEAAINDRVRQAVRETAGLILLAPDNTLPYTWFHSHSGGMTESARSGIDWQGEEPAYTKVTAGLESADAPPHVQSWTLTVTKDEFIDACRKAGSSISSCSTIRITQTGQSGRVVTLSVDGTTVNAARLRISLGSSKMRSTWLTDIQINPESITLVGRGYGHGVGMPQWGAYALAQAGWSAAEIALHYYHDLQIVKIW